jgi:hypothetical protein
MREVLCGQVSCIALDLKGPVCPKVGDRVDFLATVNSGKDRRVRKIFRVR